MAETRLLPSLSALTSPVVDHIYGIAAARPVESPLFVFLVGAPGSGKSSAHARIIAETAIEPDNYVTINLDLLLESLEPFRAASSIAQFLKQNKATKSLVKFSPITAYGTYAENLGLFKWYDEAHAELEAADPEVTTAFNSIRGQYAHLTGVKAPQRMLQLNDDAIERAIGKHVNIIYETTLSLTKAGRVTKVDKLMPILLAHGYNVLFVHIKADPAEVMARLEHRQEHRTPQEMPPFYRFIPPGLVLEFVENTAAGFHALLPQYVEHAVFMEITNPQGAESAKNTRSRASRLAHITGSYKRGGSRKRQSKQRTHHRSVTKSRRRI